MKHLEGGSRHHLIWERTDYKTSVEKAYRNHPGLIVPMWIEPHNELHAEIEPPPKPTRNQILGAISLLNELDYRDNQLNSIDSLAWHFEEQDDNLARRIGDHLFRQLDFINETGAYYNL